MHPILFEVPAFSAWIGAAALAAIGAVFVVLALRDREDKGSWWMADCERECDLYQHECGGMGRWVSLRREGQ